MDKSIHSSAFPRRRVCSVPGAAGPSTSSAYSPRVPSTTVSAIGPSRDIAAPAGFDLTVFPLQILNRFAGDMEAQLHDLFAHQTPQSVAPPMVTKPELLKRKLSPPFHLQSTVHAFTSTVEARQDQRPAGEEKRRILEAREERVLVLIRRIAFFNHVVQPHVEQIRFPERQTVDVLPG